MTGIANYFDNVSFLYRDKYYVRESRQGDTAEIITAVNKLGAKGTVELRWCAEGGKV